MTHLLNRGFQSFNYKNSASQYTFAVSNYYPDTHGWTRHRRAMWLDQDLIACQWQDPKLLTAKHIILSRRILSGNTLNQWIEYSIFNMNYTHYITIDDLIVLPLYFY